MLNIKKNKGFSLAEMMVVMLMLSIIFAAAAPILTKRANKTATSGESLPKGTIVIWSGKIIDIPTGWHLCDGSNGTPDLRNRFVVCAGADIESYGSGPEGGAPWGTTKEGVIQETTGFYGINSKGGLAFIKMSELELPKHIHEGQTAIAGNHYHAQGSESLYSLYGGGIPTPRTINWPDGSFRLYTYQYTSTTGAHNHNLTTYSAGNSEIQENRPPYYSLAYIMKL